MDKFELLQNTADVIQERGDSYGSITQCHQRIADLWSVILEKKVEPEQVALCMIALKMARLMESPDHTDSWQDIIGYAMTGFEVVNDKE